MRPIEKGDWPLTQKKKKRKSLTDWKKAIPILVERTGSFCHICEKEIDTPSIEHIFPKEHYSRLSGHWDNFLLICNSCNSRKGSERLLTPYRKNYYWPHLNNLNCIIEYSTANGKVFLKQGLTPNQEKKGENLIALYKLDAITTKEGNKDKRFQARLETLFCAIERLIEYRNGKATISAILDLAKSKGFFSIWVKVFKGFPEVLEALFDSFPGTAQNCFDPVTYQPIPRNPSNTSDPI
jgi:hypothetical protein